ncbi:MAG: universal stress protein [Bacteroidia bacterium]|nr:universal stress protein [Bacteroidia bacterium]
MDFQINNILVGFDNSLSALVALKKAADTAQRFNAKLHAVYVIRDNKGTPEEIEKAVGEIGSNMGIDIEFIKKTGKVYKEINALEREIGADLVVVGTHGTEGWQPFWIGSNAFRIVSSANCPVITVQETTKETPLQDILLPLDDDDTTRQKVPYAAVMAKTFGATVHVYSVSKKSGPRVKMRLKAYGRQTQRFLSERGIRSTFKADFGVDIPKSIMNYSKEVRAGLVMIMADTESVGMVMGSYSQDIVNNSKVPVMVMHSRDLAIAGAVGY